MNFFDKQQNISSPFILSFQEYLRNLAPKINKLDSDLELMKEIFTEYRGHGFFRMHVPAAFGGVEISPEEKLAIEIILGRYGGALSFLQAQVRIPCFLMDKFCHSEAIKENLKLVAKGELAIGNTTSTLRHVPKRFFLTGKQVEGGYMLTGHIPFASGFELFEKLLIVFQDAETYQDIFALVDFKNAPGFNLGGYLNSIAMTSIKTVPVQITELFIPEENIVSRLDPDWFNSEFFKKGKPYGYPLGIALGLLDQIEVSQHQYDLAPIYKHIALLNKKILEQSGIDECAELFDHIMSTASLISTLAIQITGGRSLLRNSSVQRLLRELQIWIPPKASPTMIDVTLKKLENLHFE